MLYAIFRSVCFRLLLPTLFFTIASPQITHAQLQGRIADKPIAIWYARNITPKRMIDYVMRLTERIEIGTTMRKQFEQDEIRSQVEGMQPNIEQPVYGVAIYMVTGLIPSFDTVSFQPVADEEDARRLLNAGKANYGDNGYMEDLGDKCFKTGYRSTSSSELPDDFDESTLARIDSPARGAWKNEQKSVEKDGKKYLETTNSMTEYCRFFDNVIYKANFEELLEMELPAASSVTSSVSTSNDMGFDAYLDRVPVGIRQLGWNMLTAAVGTQLQQRDDEPETTYNMRRSSGDLGLALTKAVLFDIDNASGWMRFASVEDDSLRGEFHIRARNNSELTKQLPAAAGISQFARILNDNAAATIHVCVRFPEEAPAALLATGTWLQDAIDQHSNGDPAMMNAARVLSETLAGIADHRNLELLAKAGWTNSSSGVFYGGIQVSENPDLLRSLHHFMTHAGGVAPNIDEIIALSEEDGRPIMRVNFPPQEVEQFAEASGMRISHAYLIHEGSRLWFAAGAENAKEILRQSIDQCNSGGLAYRTPLFTAKIDMERWLNYPQEDPSGIAPLPHWLDENASWFPPNPGMMGFGMPNLGKPTPIMQQVFNL
ncbi:MAG: hypothetical protein O2856_17375, partial [Planctomycetota bacterium]|nr:hypothetical protein [Planctomycetota bacterium]